MFNTTFEYKSPYGFGQLTLPQNPFSLGSSQPTPTQTVPLSGNTGGGTTPYLKQNFKGRVNSITQKLNKAGITDQGINQIADVVRAGTDMAQGALENGVINSKGYENFKKISNIKTGNSVIDAGLGIMNMGISAMNRWGGQKSDEFHADKQLQETMGGSYTGSFGDINDAEQGNGFYGMFSFGKRKKQNENVAKQEEIQAQLQDINEEAQDQYAAANNVQANNIKYLNKINGIDFSEFSLVAKNGIKIEYLGRIKNLNLKNRINVDKKSIEYTETEPIDKFKEGGIIDFTPIIYSYTDPIETDIEFIPIISEEIVMFKDGGKSDKKSKNRTIEELIEYAKTQNPRFIQRMSEPIRDLDLGNGQRGTHLMSWGTDDNGNAIVYSEIQENNNGDLFNYGDAAIERALKNKNYLIMTPEEAKLFTESGIDENGNLFGYKKGWPEFFKQNFKEGGQIKESEELVKLEETNQKNVIPEGALHKNKHHIENTEGLTQKGIPVIDNDGEQQAEIELDEIIFTLEVTKKLEELHKIYKEGTNKERDEAAIEAGKLLVQEILYNTDDRTGLISKCEKGGKING